MIVRVASAIGARRGRGGSGNTPEADKIRKTGGDEEDEKEDEKEDDMNNAGSEKRSMKMMKTT